MLFISLLTDTSDEVFEHPYLLTTILEDIMQVLGFIVVFIGLKKWMKYNDRQNEELITLATTDELTGLYVRRFFLDKTLDEFNRSKRNQLRFSILMIDIDHFKSINDKFGHAAGDLVLQVFAREIKGSIRKTDVIARWGGEEFVVLLVHDDGANIQEVSSVISEKIRSKTEGIRVAFNEEVIHFSVSIGATISTEEDPSIDVIIDRADKLLYQAKIKGRNCVALDLFK
ncbi:MAG: GGDEF domain-containing protein [Bermanella sp.]